MDSVVNEIVRDEDFKARLRRKENNNILFVCDNPKCSKECSIVFGVNPNKDFNLCRGCCEKLGIIKVNDLGGLY